MPFHSYIFFDTLPGMLSLSKEELESAKADFIACVSSHASLRTNAYATLGFRVGTRFMLHCNAATPAEVQLFVRDLLHTTLGKHLAVSYSLMGMKRPTQYNPKQAPAEAELTVPHTYLVVYPFTKTTEWHLLPFDERRSVMKAHVDVGRKFRDNISQMLLYAYGIDDHEFIVSYYMDSLEEFQTLVMEMRETESRRHTKNDLPIFTCTYMPLEEALTMI